VASALQIIPESLIYEMVNGRPIYYRGYKDYLDGNKSMEEVMGSSKFQAFLAAELVFLLKSFLGKEYIVFANELGLQFSKKAWRAADVAVIQRSSLITLDDKYLEIPPDCVIEIDTKADLSEISNPLGYYQEKTKELIEFGVKRIIWIFSDTQKVMIAGKGEKRWEIVDWDVDVELVSGLFVNIQDILSDFFE
jgi:Uma2 family endonuclease